MINLGQAVELFLNAWDGVHGHRFREKLLSYKISRWLVDILARTRVASCAAALMGWLENKLSNSALARRLLD